MSREHDLIRRYCRRETARRDVILNIGDDAAVLRSPEATELVATIDSLVAGVHFDSRIQPGDLGHRALAVNLSDLAAMGANPAWAMLALTASAIEEPWLASLMEGFLALAAQYNVALVGGDLTRGPVTLTVQIMGHVPVGEAITRSGARPGDIVCVTGWVGDAALALAAAAGDYRLKPDDLAACRRRLARPNPRIKAGLALRGRATAAIDISDGLLADLGHILRSSGVGAVLQLESLPLSPGLSEIIRAYGAWDLPLNGGDDYELLFTIPPRYLAPHASFVDGLDCDVTPIGRIESSPGLRCRLQDRPFDIATQGYDHFAD